MSKQTFSPQAAMEMLQKEETMLRRNVPRLKITEPIVTALFALIAVGTVLISYYGMLATTYAKETAHPFNQLPLLQDALQLLNINDENQAVLVFLVGGAAAFVVCAVVALLLRLPFLGAKADKEQPLPADYLKSLDAVLKKAQKVKSQARVQPHVIRWILFCFGGGLILMLIMASVAMGTSHPDYFAAMVATIMMAGMFLGVDLALFAIMRWIFMQPETVNLVCYDLERDAQKAYNEEVKRQEKERKENEKAQKLQEATELFHAGKFEESRKIIMKINDAQNGDLAAMKALTDTRLGKKADGAQQAYKLLWDAKELGFRDHKIRDAVDAALAQIKPLMMEQSQDQLTKAYAHFLNGHHASVIYDCEALAEFGHPDAIMLMLVSKTICQNDPRRYPEWMALAKKAKRRGFDPMFEEIFQELITKLEAAIRYNKEYEKERANRQSTFSGGTYYPNINTWAEPSGWTDFRTGETLYRVNGKIVNANGEEVSPAWWE